MFHSFVGIDYSGAGTAESPQRGIQVALATSNRPAERVVVDTARPRRAWSRVELWRWIDQLVESQENVIIGMDHGFSFPMSYFERYNLRTWSQFLDDFIVHWPTADGPVRVEHLRPNNERVGDSAELRLTERWTPGAKSVFQFDVQGSVAKSTHAGLPFIQRLRKSHRKRLHFWPFDGWHPDSGKSVICEIFPSLFRNRYPREDRTVDEQDAFAVCSWMREMQSINRLGDFFDPPLMQRQLRIAKREGWILGVL